MSYGSAAAAELRRRTGRYPRPIASPTKPVPRDLRPMLAVPAEDAAARRRHVGLRDEVGRHARPRRASTAATSGSRRGPATTPPPASPRSRRSRDALGGVDALLDGELVALDEHGVPSFERLQPRMQAHGRAAVRRGARDPARRAHGVRRALARRATPRASCPTPNGARCSIASGSLARRGRPRRPRSAPATRCSRPSRCPRARRRRRQAHRQPLPTRDARRRRGAR